MKKRKGGWTELYSKERERYYRRNGWGLGARELSHQEEISVNLNRDILEREKGTQLQYEVSRIRDTRYNKSYKLIEKRVGGCKYILVIRIYLRDMDKIGKKRGKGIRVLMRVRCGNMGEDNKYWLREEKKHVPSAKGGRITGSTL